MRAASPIPVTAGPPRSQRLRGGFLRRMPEKTAESNSRRALPPRAPPLLCGCFLVRNTPRGRSFVRRTPEKTAESNSRRALPPRAPPLLCGCFLVRNTPRGRNFVRRMPEKTAEFNSRRALPPRAPPLLCGCFLARNTPRGRSFLRRMPEKTAESNSRWALPPRAPPLLSSCLHGMEARQKKRLPRSLNSGASAAYFIRRETAAGTRAGCSSLPRTAKRHRRERACPCRSR